MIKIIFGQGDEQPEFSWLDKVEWDFMTKTEVYTSLTKEKLEQILKDIQ